MTSFKYMLSAYHIMFVYLFVSKDLPHNLVKMTDLGLFLLYKYLQLLPLLESFLQ